MTKLNAGSSGSAIALQASIRADHRSHSNRNNRLLEICVSSWKQGSSSNPNRDKNALFAILPISIFLVLCALLSACAGTSSDPATAPVITTQPAKATVTVGQTATFTVAAAGTAPLSYQWTKNGMSVGTNSATYTTAATTSSDNNAKIQVMVSNSKGSAPSSVAHSHRGRRPDETDDHHATGERNSHSWPDRNLHRGCDGHSSAYVSVDQEWDERRDKLRHLHDCGDGIG